jgi:non-specific serine/threonine protein kinase/serine/threonine-protein kinase
MGDDAPTRDDRFLDLARRLADGEKVDLDAEVKGLDAELARGFDRLRQVMGFPESPASDEIRTQTQEATPRLPPLSQQGAGRRIGRYLLVRKLGEGGMGVVWEAEQDRPRRRVALKVIRGGVHVDEAALRLFQREVQTLALLQHPGIAVLYESGATEDGLHWFAMELVRGVTLRAWLDRRPAGPVTPAELRLRLRVFRKVCEAVAYAHQRGVIHRDLKPANVLVPMDESAAPDAVPEIKILDFGLARITESDTGMTSYHTEIGQVRGTLPYMSPEQVRGNPADIDLRTDVYALGVMLYELVTGKLPLDVTRASLLDAMRVICEEPPRSISVTFSGTRRLDVDVITIAEKALEKDPARRYQSAAALGDDVRRWLDDEPILARPPSATYQFRKLVMRHKLPFAFAGAVFVLLAVLAGAMTVQAARIAKERDRANQAAQRAEEEAKRATEEAATAKSVSDFLEGMFKDADPAQSRGATITAKEILDRGAARIQKDLADQPIVQMRLVNTMFRVYDRLSLLDEAKRLVKAAAPLIDRYPDRIESADLLDWLVWSDAGKPVAIEMAKRAIRIREHLLPPSDPRIARSYYSLGTACGANFRLDDEVKAYTAGLARLDAADPDDTELRIWFLAGLATNSNQAGDAQRLLDYSRAGLALRERFYPSNHPERLLGESYLAYGELLLGRTASLRPVLTRVIREGERVWGKDSIFLGWILQTMAELERREGRLEQAKILIERCIRIETSLHIDPVHPAYVITLALTEEGLGHPERALRLLESDLQKRRASAGSESPVLLMGLEALRGVLSRSGRTAEAAEVAARADRIRAAYKLPATAGTLF